MINIIVAASTNMVIGKDGVLPWHLPTDLKYFKEITKDHIVVMGRKCWESIPEKYRPLPNRENIIVTRDKNYVANGGVVVNDLNGILTGGLLKNNKEIFIIGGAEIYKQSFKYADRLYLTQIYQSVDGDTFLDGLDIKDWSLSKADKMLNENGFTFRFEVYEKNSIKKLAKVKN